MSTIFERALKAVQARDLSDIESRSAYGEGFIEGATWMRELAAREADKRSERELADAIRELGAEEDPPPMRKPFAVGDRVAVRYPTAQWHGNPPQGFEASVQKHIARVLAVRGNVVLVQWEKPMVGRNTFLASQCRRLVRSKRARLRVAAERDRLRRALMRTLDCLEQNVDDPDTVALEIVREALAGISQNAPETDIPPGRVAQGDMTPPDPAGPIDPFGSAPG